MSIDTEGVKEFYKLSNQFSDELFLSPTNFKPLVVVKALRALHDQKIFLDDDETEQVDPCMIEWEKVAQDLGIKNVHIIYSETFDMTSLNNNHQVPEFIELIK